MADENAILTALGLDTSQYVDGIDKATTATQAFAQVGSELDGLIRQIPIIGTVWEITGGKVVDGFAKMTTSAREFQEIMNSDTSGSLTATLDVLQQTQSEIGNLKNFDLGRFFAETIGDMVNPDVTGTMSSDGTYSEKFSSKESARMEALNELEKKRTELIEQSVGLYENQAMAQSEILSGSEELSAQNRITLDLATKEFQIKKDAAAQFGPEGSVDRAKNEAKANKYIEERTAIIQEQSDLETKALAIKTQLRTNINALDEQAAALQASSTAFNSENLGVDSARLELKRAEVELEAAIAIGIKERIADAKSAETVAQSNLKNEEKIQAIYNVKLEFQKELNALTEAEAGLKLRSIPSDAQATALSLAKLQQTEAYVKLDEAILTNDQKAIENAKSEARLASLNVSSVEKENGLYKINLTLQEKIAELDMDSLKASWEGLAIDEAKLEVEKAQANLDAAELTTDDKGIAAARSQLALAKEKKNITQLEKDIKDEMHANEAKARSLELRGTTKEQQAQDLKNKYDARIAEAERRNVDGSNQAEVDSLKSQRGDDKLQQDIDRSNETPQERSDRRKADRQRQRDTSAQESLNAERERNRKANESPGLVGDDKGGAGDDKGGTGDASEAPDTNPKKGDNRGGTGDGGSTSPPPGTAPPLAITAPAIEASLANITGLLDGGNA